MSEPYDWTKHWQPHRRDGMRVVGVLTVEPFMVAVTDNRHDVAYEAYPIYENGRVAVDRESHRDLLPVVREPVLVPWKSVLMLPPNAMFRRKCERFGYAVRRIDYDRHEVGLTDNVTVSLAELAEEFVYIPMGNIGANWLPCGTREMPQ